MTKAKDVRTEVGLTKTEVAGTEAGGTSAASDLLLLYAPGRAFFGVLDDHVHRGEFIADAVTFGPVLGGTGFLRSEEHTSELQSR